MLRIIRLKLIKFLIDMNEKLFFERNLKSFYRKSTNINRVIDVGANKGQTIDFFLSINPNCEIYSIEANPTLYNFLVDKYKNRSNIKIFNIGISNTKGKKLFNENVLDYTSSFESLNFDSGYLDQKAKIIGIEKANLIASTYEVQTSTLADFITSNIADQKIDLIKIDTEGHEFYCLQGLFDQAIVNYPAYIQIEQQANDMYLNRTAPEQIDSLLKKNGYSEIAKIKHGIGEYYEKVYRNQKSF
jgi:FkbM family methyltransferase